MTNKSRGFTLIELMIILAIAGILLAIAIPAFRDYEKRKAGGTSFSQPIPVQNDFSVSTEESRCRAKADLMKLNARFDGLTGCTVQVGDRFVPIDSVRFDAEGNAQ